MIKVQLTVRQKKIISLLSASAMALALSFHNCARSTFESGFQLRNLSSEDANRLDVITDCSGHWGVCNKSCDGGQQLFIIDTPASFGGKSCAYKDGATRQCNTVACSSTSSVSCAGRWSSCSLACNGLQYFEVVQDSRNGGAQCSFTAGASRFCNSNSSACHVSPSTPPSSPPTSPGTPPPSPGSPSDVQRIQIEADPTDLQKLTTQSAREHQLTCGADFKAILPASKTIQNFGTDLGVSISFTEKFGAVANSFYLINKSAGVSEDILEARSTAGAAYQYSSFIYGHHGENILINQGAGNGKDLKQWGYYSPLATTADGTSVYPKAWAPYFSDSVILAENSPMMTTGPCSSFSSTSNSYVQFDYGAPATITRKVKTPTQGEALYIKNSVQLLSNQLGSLNPYQENPQFTGQYWKDYYPVMAFYMNRAQARRLNQRTYFITTDNVASPEFKIYDTFDLTLNGGWGRPHGDGNNTWYVDFTKVKWVAFVYNIAGKDIGLAVPMNGRFDLRLDPPAYCDQRKNNQGQLDTSDVCTSMSTFNVKPSVTNASFLKNSVREYNFEMFVGTPAQLIEIIKSR